MGDISMDHFELNLSEIHALQFPLTCHRCTIGRFYIKIPYAQITTRPIILEISDVRIDLGLPQDPTFDPHALWHIAQSQISMYQQLFQDWFLTQVTESSEEHHEDDSRPRDQMNFLSKPMAASILRNMSITIAHIHMSFGDTLSNNDDDDVFFYDDHQYVGRRRRRSFSSSSSSSSSYALGLVIQHIKVFPATSFQPSLLSASRVNITEAYVKDIEITALAMYTSSSRSRRTTREAKRTTTTSVGNDRPDSSCWWWPGRSEGAHEHLTYYVLEPLNIECSVRLTLSDRSYPQPETIDFQINIRSRVQWNWCHELLPNVFHSMQKMDQLDRLMVYRRFRPPPVTKKSRRNWKMWWKYAIRCVVMDLLDPFNRTFRSPNKKRSLMLVGLYYTRMRQKLVPFLVRDPASLRGEYLVDASSSSSSSSVEYSSSPDVLQDVHFHHQCLQSTTSIMTTLDYLRWYGLVFHHHPTDTSRSTETKSEASEEKHLLWLRQLSIEACFRPMVIARLRSVMQQQQFIREKTIRYRSQKPLAGIFTLTLGNVVGFPSSRLKLYCKVSMLEGGCSKSYRSTMGIPEPQVMNRSCYSFCQTFEFHMWPTTTEQKCRCRIELFDQWPLRDQKVGEILLDVQSYIRQDLDERGHVFSSHPITMCRSRESKISQAAHRMSLAMLFIEASDPRMKMDDLRRHVKTSKHVFLSHFGRQSDYRLFLISQEAKYHSAYGEEMNVVKTSSMHVLVDIPAGIHVRAAPAGAPGQGQALLSLDCNHVVMGKDWYFDPEDLPTIAKVKMSMKSLVFRSSSTNETKEEDQLVIQSFLRHNDGDDEEEVPPTLNNNTLEILSLVKDDQLEKQISISIQPLDFRQWTMTNDTTTDTTCIHDHHHPYQEIMSFQLELFQLSREWALVRTLSMIQNGTFQSSSAFDDRLQQRSWMERWMSCDHHSAYTCELASLRCSWYCRRTGEDEFVGRCAMPPMTWHCILTGSSVQAFFNQTEILYLPTSLSRWYTRHYVPLLLHAGLSDPPKEEESLDDPQRKLLLKGFNDLVRQTTLGH